MGEEAGLVVVGAGTAASELVVQARQGGWAGPIVMLGDEPYLPYHRPPLSKAWLQGEGDAATLGIRPPSAYERAAVTWRGGQSVVAIDRSRQRVYLADGEGLPYRKLALCTGGRPRPWAVDGLANGDRPVNLHVLRGLDDALGLQAALVPGRNLVVVGAGYVGLEVAATARRLGVAVTVLEAQPRVLARATGVALSGFYERLHRAEGVDLRTGVTVRSVARAGGGVDAAITALALSDGSRLVADVVVAGIGMLPNAELAAAAGLAVDGGIIVDDLSRTSDPDIVAAGDCTVQDLPGAGGRQRLESVPNALEQARAAASWLCGQPRPNRSVPWFWSDQYGLKLQMVGLTAGYDQFECRGEMSTAGFMGFYLRQGVVIAAEAVNRAADFAVAKRLVAGRAVVDPVDLASPARPLRDLLAQAEVHAT